MSRSEHDVPLRCFRIAPCLVTVSTAGPFTPGLRMTSVPLPRPFGSSARFQHENRGIPRRAGRSGTPPCSNYSASGERGGQYREALTRVLASQGDVLMVRIMRDEVAARGERLAEHLQAMATALGLPGTGSERDPAVQRTNWRCRGQSGPGRLHGQSAATGTGPGEATGAVTSPARR